MNVALRIGMLMLVGSLLLACDASRSEGHIDVHLLNLDRESGRQVRISLISGDSTYTESYSLETLQKDSLSFSGFKSGTYKVAAWNQGSDDVTLQKGLSPEFVVADGEIVEVSAILLDIRYETCEPDATSCDGISGWDVVLTCSGGESWEPLETCNADKHCDQGVCVNGSPADDHEDGDEDGDGPVDGDADDLDGDMEADDDTGGDDNSEGISCGEPITVTCNEQGTCLPILPTGQTLCYGIGAGIIECPGEAGSDACGQTENCGQDAQYLNEQRSLENGTVGEDNYVCDSQTTLVWQQTFEEDLTWDEAVVYCRDLAYAGESDWRLPTRSELRSIADYGSASPALNTQLFPGIETEHDDFWTSTTLSINDEKAFYINFGMGSAPIENKTESLSARCVRGGPTVATVESVYESATPEPGEQIVTDTGTQLIWQAVATGDKTWTEALAYCEGLVYSGFDDWRVPDLNELTSLVNMGAYRPASTFPNMPPNWFWTSTSITGDALFAWIINFKDYGEPSSVYKTPASRAHVRCVRGPGLLKCNNDTCIDEDAGLEWERRPGDKVNFSDAESYCEDLNLDGYGDWRLPTIDELRALVRQCSKTEAGGSCYVSETCDHAECQDSTCKGCEGGDGPSLSGCYWDPGLQGACNWYWSGTDYANSPQSQAWFLDFHSALIGNVGKSDENYARCVRIWHRL